ncbi:MAG TPA: TIGR03560 family F420-dependent LLM class oxidoreductase [Candidatus Limnocylindrales bacterium]|nr:TIGR03560 family F420-dependent LLM class oxidoreductase [Candidatus Limnocylindrales bacterium]
MRFGAAFWVTRTTWPAVRDACVLAERSGWDSVWIDDHLLADEGDWTDPKLEGWATLAAVAALTERVQVGLLVAANTFRNPGLTAKLATTLDQISGGRAVLGIGAGWFDREHDAFGLDFGSGFGERLDRLDEAIGLIRRLLAGERVTHDGRFYRLLDAVCAPLPVQARLPILIGGMGPKKTLPMIARHADMWNGKGTPDELAAAAAILRARCAEIGRDPAEIERSVFQNVVVRDTRAAAGDAWEGYRARHGPHPGEDEAELLGPPDEVAAQLREYEAVGIDHAIWVFRDPFDAETISRLGDVRAALGVA